MPATPMKATTDTRIDAPAASAPTRSSSPDRAAARTFRAFADLRHARRTARVAAIATVSFTLACATVLEPATDSGTGDACERYSARSAAAGVEVEVRTQAWRWHPRSLGQLVTPFLVKIQVPGDTAAVVDPSRFVLADPQGRRRFALPPFEIDATLAAPIEGYAYDLRSFQLAPHLRSQFPGARTYVGAFAYDPTYYRSGRRILQKARLPTADMLSHALPEGVIEPGGSVTGFVYFEPIDDPADDRVFFRFHVTGAEGGERLGTVEIPFIARSGIDTWRWPSGCSD